MWLCVVWQERQLQTDTLKFMRMRSNACQRELGSMDWSAIALEWYGATRASWVDMKVSGWGKGWLFNGNEYSTAERQEVGSNCEVYSCFSFGDRDVFSLKDRRVVGRVHVLNRIAVALRCVTCYVLLRGYAADWTREREYVLVSNDFFRFFSLRRLSFFQRVFGVVTVRSLYLSHRALMEAWLRVLW